MLKIQWKTKRNVIRHEWHGKVKWEETWSFQRERERKSERGKMFSWFFILWIINWNWQKLGSMKRNDALDWNEIKDARDESRAETSEVQSKKMHELAHFGCCKNANNGRHFSCGGRWHLFNRTLVLIVIKWATAGLFFLYFGLFYFKWYNWCRLWD